MPAAGIARARSRGYTFGDQFLGGGWHVVAEPKIWWPFLPADNPPDFLNYLGYGQMSIEMGRTP